MEEKFLKDIPDGPDCEEQPGSGRFAELEELRRDIARRIRDNQRFLERFLEENFVDEDEALDEPPEEPEL
jgi:hypothetical protein